MKWFIIAFAGIAFATSLSFAKDPEISIVPVSLPKDSRLAIIGDSITERKIYSAYMEVYLLACIGRKDVEVFQFGWGGETAYRFLKRLKNNISFFQPTVAMLSYGMNDGQYRPYNMDIGKAYEEITAGRFSVTWGTETRQFTKGQLESGVNLAAEFSTTPFEKKFMKILEEISVKQDFEVKISKELVNKFCDFSQQSKDGVELRAAFDNFKKDLMMVCIKKDEAVKALITPVKYSILIVSAR